VVSVLKRAVKTMKAGDHPKAARLALKALDAAPQAAMTNHVMALCLYELGRLSTALTFYERAWRLDPKNPDIYLNLGHTAWKLDMLEAAEKFFRLYSQLAPGRPDAAVNLGGVLRDQGKFSEAVEILRAAIYAAPDSAYLWNALGAVILESGDPEQALTFYLEAIRVQPGYARGHYNMAFCLDLMGRTDEAIDHFRKALSLGPSLQDQVTMEHGLSMALLAAGELREGWALYERRLHPLYKARVAFALKSPYWSGAEPEAVRGKRLLLVGEQGLGDEIMHAGALEEAFDLVGPQGSVGLVCERRLTAIMERSFPALDHVSAHATIFKEGMQIRSVHDAETRFKPDLWAPMASLQRALRPTPDSFPGREANAYFTPDPDRVDSLRAQIANLPDGVRVGFVWKSKLTTGNRTKYFSPFEMWRPVLETPGCTFVCLQYGDVEEELARCERDFGVTIHRIDGLDLMNDLEGVGIAGSLMDVSVGQHNTSLALAAAYGGETWLLSPARTQWTTFGADYMPWSPGSTLFAPARFRDFADPVGRMAEALRDRAGARGRGAA
jgi:tetratricopeptide (TPR) repeat protein